VTCVLIQFISDRNVFCHHTDQKHCSMNLPVICMTFIVRLKYINITELYNRVPHMIVIFFIAGVHTFLMILQ